jgi:hypothetical protein
VVQYTLNFSQEAARGVPVATVLPHHLVIEAPCSKQQGIFDPQGTIVIPIAR